MTTAASAPALFFAQVDRMGDRVAMRQYSNGDGRESPSWSSAPDGPERPDGPGDLARSWREWGQEVRCFGGALAAGGFQPGETVAVFAGNRMLWPVAELGILSAGLISTGIYPTSAPAQVRELLADCGATAVVVDTPARLTMVMSLRSNLPALRVIVAENPPTTSEGIVSWSEWLGRGDAALTATPLAAELAARTASLGPETCATLIYTSGSTGTPRGARIPHRYLMESASSVRDTLELTHADTSLSFLPYCHAGERVFGLYTRILCGMETMLVEDHAHVWDAARAFGPTLFGGLPRFYEKAYETLRSERQRASGVERERWERALSLGRTRYHLRRRGSSPSPALEGEWRDAIAPLNERAREYFGGRLRLATSGGAALMPEVAEFLDAIGVPILGAYGMTEHLCVSCHRPGHHELVGVGSPMPGTEIRVAADGELLVRRCGLTFDGYHGRPNDTRDAFTPDGEWLRTGDLGMLDEQGDLHITGRKKELIALSTGKKVAPLPIETRLTADPWIGQAMLYGEGRKFISALLTLRQTVVESWARERGLAPDLAELSRHPVVMGYVARAVERVNAELSRTEQIRGYVVLERELALESEELTPTFKVRRARVAERFGERLDALYR